MKPDTASLERARRWLEGADRRHFLWYGHPQYPPLLAQSPQPPLALFIDGDADALWQPAIAVIGSRSASHSGRSIAADLARSISQRGLMVASGLAAGIDAAAHRAALEAASSGLAVVGTGLDIAYPRHHARLQAALASHGAVVSEFAPGTAPLPRHFPARNRILAGLVMAVVVVEAAERSGALLTARLASEAGRDVFAVPGSIHNPLSRGCHRLLRDGAGLLESLDDLLPTIVNLCTTVNGLLDLRKSTDAVDRTAPPPGLESQSLLVWQSLEHSAIDMDELGLRTGLTVTDLSSILLALELEGWIVAERGRYQRA